MGMELRNGYVLGFSPVDRRHDGHYHGVQIQIIQPVSLPPLRGYRATGLLRGLKNVARAKWSGRFLYLLNFQRAIVIPGPWSRTPSILCCASYAAEAVAVALVNFTDTSRETPGSCMVTP